MRAPHGGMNVPQQAAVQEKKTEKEKEVRKRTEEKEKEAKKRLETEKRHRLEKSLAKLEPLLQGTDQAGIAFLKAKVVDGGVLSDTGLLYKVLANGSGAVPKEDALCVPGRG